jgi:hypothetical protein
VLVCLFVLVVVAILKQTTAGNQWLTPVILATWEADQQDCSLRPVQGNSLQHPHLQNSQRKID